MVEGTWAVVYQDGSIQAQLDPNSRGYLVEGGEVPYRAIDWTQAKSVLFHSNETTAQYDVAYDANWHVSLRSRVFMTRGGVALRAFILLVSVPGEEVNEESVKSAVYWFPTGVTHECFSFDCAEVRRWASAQVHGRQEGLMPIHEQLETTADAVIE